MTPTRLAYDRLHTLNAELKFSAAHRGLGSHDVLENKWVIGRMATISQNSISFKQKELA
jgi:hypothetical protein